MRALLAAALALATALPAAAQPAARPPKASPGTAQVAGTPGTPGTRSVDVRSPDIEASIQRAQAAADARAKAWDAKMRRTMGSICSGC